MASTPTIRGYDAVLTDGTTPLGLKLAPGTKLTRSYARSLSPQQFESLTEASFPPEQETPFTQKEWHAGFGKQYYTAKRYYQAIGTDASVKGLIYPGPVAVATTNSTPTYANTTTITNGGFETNDLSSWTVVTEGDAVAWATQNTLVRTGSYGVKVSTAAGDPELKNTLTSVDSSLFNGLSITVSAYGRESAAAVDASLQVILKDANGTQIAASAVTALSELSWTEVAVTHAFTDGWPQLVVHLKLTSFTPSGVEYVAIDDVTVSVTGTIGTAANMGTIVKLIDFNSNHYAVSDTGVWKRTTNNWARVAGSPDAITDAETDGTSLYLARGTSKNYWYMASGETFLRNTGTGASSQPIKLLWFNGSMYGTDDPQTAWKYSTLSSGATSATYTIGDIGQNFTAAVVAIGAAAEAPFFIKEGGAAYVNASGTVVPIASELKSLDNANTGKNSIAWRGDGALALYMPAGAGATLLAYDAGDVVNIGPDAFAERLSDFTGQIVATAGDDQWLYIVMDNSAKIEILKGRYETIDGATDFRWHPFFEDTYTTVAYAHVSSITAKRLYYGGGTALPKYIPLPTKYGDPLNDTNLTFKTGTTHEGSWIDFGVPNISKTFRLFTLDSVSLSGTARTVKVEYNLWGETSWTTLATPNTSPSQTVAFAANTKSTRIRFRFTLNTDNSANGLGILAYTLFAVLNPPRLQTFHMICRVASDNQMKGQRDTDMTYTKVAPKLHSWVATDGLTLTIPDGTADGVSYTVKFAPDYPPKEVFQELGTLDAQGVRTPVSWFEMLLQAERTS